MRRMWGGVTGHNNTDKSAAYDIRMGVKIEEKK